MKQCENERKQLQVGDIIEWDVGYTMRLPHFAIIESFTKSGKSARIRELESAFTEIDPYGQSGYKIPTGRKIGALRTCRIKKIGNDRSTSYVAVDGHWSHPWNGEPVLYDTYD